MSKKVKNNSSIMSQKDFSYWLFLLLKYPKREEKEESIMLYSRQSQFSRTRYNEGKAGAYYTDLAHCKDIAKAFAWPDGEVSVLEPSIGDASAVKAVTKAEENSKVRIFGVELMEKPAKAVKDDPIIEDCLCADFTDGVTISHNAFGFIFQNPPYLEDTLDEDKERLELQFLKKTGDYLIREGIQVCVISHRQLIDLKYLRYFLSRYEVLFLYRFRPEEYSKFHQVVICGRKKPLQMVQSEELNKFLLTVQLPEMIPELPDYFEEKIAVPEAPADAVKIFAKKVFSPEDAMEELNNAYPEEILKVFDENVSMKQYAAVDIGKPPIPLKKDSLYLMAVAGAGQGLAGDEKNGDLHLQRGVAEVSEDTEVIEKNGKNVLKSTSSTKISLTIVENDGKIKELV